ncbi:hypothetical protein [Brevibacterium aurantiacum]|uniref:Uncharacterized protein n=1 Tax=Brevibacterium aurantiacum TaxID=273384 RepID=A0A556CK46_BREAU|nr:hypothetical protein [Brevibacterium aurantiacum]TSI17805.1 hypothetical protein FO013_06325 [Brevibacterium aurantiacum]
MQRIERDREIARMGSSGWATLDSVPRDIADEASRFVSSQNRAWWSDAEELGAEMSAWLEGRRFCEQVELGLLYVPKPTVLDVRTAMPLQTRQEQRSDLLDDVVHARLNEGRDLVPEGAKGQLFLTCVGEYGISAGSYEDIRSASDVEYTVAGHDVRLPMTRQLWGSRVLQAGTGPLPDTEHNEAWTFTLFVGDELVDGLAASGTILKSHVRFRLGKANRGIGSARVAPAIPISTVS